MNAGDGITLTMYVYDWRVRQHESEGAYKKNFSLKFTAYGVTETGALVCVQLDNVKTYVLLEFPDHYDVAKHWNRILPVLGSAIYVDSDKNCSLINSTPLYGVRPKKNFVKVSFSSNVGKWAFINRLNGLKRYTNNPLVFPEKLKGNEVIVHCADMTTETQVLETLKLPTCGWITSHRAYRCHNSSSRFDELYRTRASTFSPRPDMSAVPPRVRLLSWDIEAKINDMSQMGLHIYDSIYMISCVVVTLGTNVPAEKHLFVRCSSNTAPTVDGTTVHVYDTEQRLLLGFSEFCRTSKAVARLGWNTFRFDNKVLVARANRLNCINTILDLGLNPPGCVKNIRGGASSDGCFIDTEGVICMDAMEMVKNTFTKLSKYSLQHVSELLLNEGKDPVTLSDLNRCYDELDSDDADAALRRNVVAKYCVRDSELSARHVVEHDLMTSLFEMAVVTRTLPSVVHHQRQQRRVYNLVHHECISKNVAFLDATHKSRFDSLDTEDKYTGALVKDPKPGLYTRVGSLDVNSMYPSLIMAYNLCYTTVVDDNVITMHDDDCEYIEWGDHFGCEHDVTKSEYDALNVKATTVALTEGEQIRRRTLKARIASMGGNRKICKIQKLKVIKPSSRRGLLPDLVRKLTEARKQVRKTMSATTDDKVKSLLNQRQLAYKVSANSVYGTTGASRGLLPCRNVAMATTATGRDTITKAIRIAEDDGNEVIYSDTDSIYVQLNERYDYDQCWQHFEKLASDITSQLREPMRIEFEQVIYYKILFLAKKSYICRRMLRDGSVSRHLEFHGGISVRRDQSAFVKDVHDVVVRAVFADSDMETIKLLIFNKCLSLFRYEVAPRKLTLTSEVRDVGDGYSVKSTVGDKWRLGDYAIRARHVNHDDMVKSGQLNALKKFYLDQVPSHVRLASKMKERGISEAIEGGRIEYLNVISHVNKGGAVIEEIGFYEANSAVIQINRLHYVQQLEKPIDKVVEAVWNRSGITKDAISPFVNFNRVIEEMERLMFSPIVRVSH